MNFFENFSFSRFLFSLQYMWKGMLCIFIVIGVLVALIVGLNRAMNGLAKKSDSND